MAFGFGFNKAKVLASAEKYVQQGKLQNAISEYEKIAEKDPKDLTVLNTIGDLYARQGETEKAADCFKRVGDSYASDGFTVKAIAMYKKLTKMTPGSTPVVQRLAELYTQQGLFNDARHQYLQLADHCIKTNDLNGAARVFQKMLDMDPDNASLQSKLADLYVKMGKKDEAREIFQRAAQSLHDRGSNDQANQALEHLLKIDPANVEALLMRGKIALDAGDGASAAKFLEKVPNIDSRLDGLQALLKAHTLAGDTSQLEAVARKLASVHNDVSGIRRCADSLLSSGNAERALALYVEFADRLLVGDSTDIVTSLQAMVGHMKDSVSDLEKLKTLFLKANAVSNIPELNELLAHAYVQSGELTKARDLYKELADLEPSNSVHMQNYRQVQTRLGEEPTAKQLTESEGEQAFLVEEVEPAAIEQEYTTALKDQINTALTDAELFESYNKPAQALPALETVLKKAPNDFRINQRLVSVYARLGRLADAAARCEKLSQLYGQAGHAEDSHQYAEMAAKYRERLGAPSPAAPVAEMPVVAPEPVAEVPLAEQTQEISAEAFNQAMASAEGGEAHEIDLSAEWEAALLETPAPAPAESAAESAAAEEATPQFEVTAAKTHPGIVADLLEEIQFYLSQSMWDEARSGIMRCEAVAPNNLELAELKQQLENASHRGAAAPAEEVSSIDVDLEAPPLEVDEADENENTLVSAAPMEAPEFQVAAVLPDLFPEPVEPKAPAPPAPVRSAPAIVPEIQKPIPPAVPVQPAFVAPPVTQIPAALASAPAKQPSKQKDVLEDMVLDLESALGDDFATPPPIAAAAAAAESPSAIPAPSIQPAMVASPTAVAVPAGTSAPEMTSASSMLSDLFEEFKEEVGEPAEEQEDPETHYNLGVAFKEMGLLDEAIGELQKVCRAIDSGAEFAQTIQVYTWLANCFIEKGVPEAAIKWYEKGLTVADNIESVTALHYDLASAYEASGNKQQALRHFTEVYGSNIDYRDVAERIKALKS